MHFSKPPSIDSCQVSRSLGARLLRILAVWIVMACFVLLGAKEVAWSQDSSDDRSQSPSPSSSDPAETKSAVLRDALTAARPSWVRYPPANPSQAYRQPGKYLVSSGPHVDDAACRRALNEKLIAAATEFVESYLQHPQAMQLLQYDERALLDQLVEPEYWYQESQQFAIGDMRQAYALVDFDDAFCQDLQHRWKAVVAASRLKQWALVAGGILSLLGITRLYLRSNAPTEAGESRRLKFVTATAILLVGSAGFVIAKQMIWL
jgi:hypothetical protein